MAVVRIAVKMTQIKNKKRFFLCLKETDSNRLPQRKSSQSYLMNKVR
jgi:hypothetical protein